jgi:hypothetical protein
MSGGGGWSPTIQPLAIVLFVLLLGACVYLWWAGYLRSRAAMIVLAGAILALGYLGFFTQPV